MADKHDQWAETLSAEHSGWLTGFLADEGKIDRRMLWRLGSWGIAAVGAVVVAVLASQSQIQLRRDQFTATDILNRQAQQIQFVAKETHTEAKRLASAIETLSGDRDRLYARMTSVEQGLESVTGSIKRQAQPAFVATAPTPAPPVATEAVPRAAAPATMELPAIPSTSPAKSTAPQTPSAEAPPAKPPVTAPVAEAVPSPANPISAPLMAWKSMMASPDTTTTKLSEPAPSAGPAPPASETTGAIPTAPTEPAPATAETVTTPVARTEFGVDIGGANSVDGLRAIWRGISKSKALTGLRPIMTVKERPTGLGMQLRLVAGPLADAADAAKICAALAATNRPCETSIFDGQRLALKAEPAPQAVPAPIKPAPRKRPAPKPQEHAEQAPPPKPVVEEAPPPPKPQSPLSSFLGIR